MERGSAYNFQGCNMLDLFPGATDLTTIIAEVFDAELPWCSQSRLGVHSVILKMR